MTINLLLSKQGLNAIKRNPAIALAAIISIAKTDLGIQTADCKDVSCLSILDEEVKIDNVLESQNKKDVIMQIPENKIAQSIARAFLEVAESLADSFTSPENLADKYGRHSNPGLVLDALS